MITFPCPGCGRALRAPEQFTGKNAHCPDCAAVSGITGFAPLGEQAPSQHDATLPFDEAVRPRRELPRDNIAGYLLVEELGRGGSGVVYKARQVKLNRLVALKMLAAEHASAELLPRFRTEAEAIARLQHPHIVAVYEVGEHNGFPFFSMELCSGGSLADKLNGTPLPAREAAHLVQTLAEAMHMAHQANLIHRDLKPGNILIAADGNAKVSDFGLARKLDEDSQATADGVILGTPSYMAPEQAQGKIHELGPACDIYALGAVLYELLTGRPPFKAVTAVDTLLQVVADEPVPPRQLQSKTPVDLETICLKCLHKEPARRYPSAAELAEDLRRYQRGEPTQARPLGRWQRSVKWVRRNPQVASLLATVGLILLLGVVVSSLFALAAGQQADRARQSALVAQQNELLATLNAQKAEANARRAQESEKQAKESERQARESEKQEKENEQRVKRALEEEEETILDSLLGAFGQKEPLTPSAVQQSRPLDPAEAEALGQMAGLSSDRLRLLLLDRGLQTGQGAARLGRCAEWLIQATVGLDERRRSQVEQFLTARLRDKDSSSEVKQACVRLGIALELRDPLFPALAADILVVALGKASDTNLLRSLADDLDALSDRLDAATSAQVADALLAASKRTSDYYTLVALANSLEAASKHLDAAGVSRLVDGMVAALNGTTRFTRLPLASKVPPLCERVDDSGAARVAESLVAALAKSEDATIAPSLVSGLKVVCERLDAATAAKLWARVADPLVVALGKSSDYSALNSLALALKTVSDHLDTVTATRASTTLVAALSKTSNSYFLQPPADALKALSERLDNAGAAKVAVALVAALSKTRSAGYALNFPLEGLKAVSKRLDAADAASISATLVAAMSKNEDAPILASLAQGLQAMCDRLEPTAAATHCARAADALVAALGKTDNDLTRQWLAQGLQAVSERLGASVAARVADVLVAALKKTTAPASISRLIAALKAVSDRLDAASAVRHCTLAADVLVAALDKNNNSYFLPTLAEGVKAVSDRLDAATAARVAAALVAAINKPSAAPVGGTFMADCFKALTVRLDDAGAARLASGLVAAMSKANDASRGSPLNAYRVHFLADGLKSVSDRLDADTAGKVAAALATALEHSGNWIGYNSLVECLKVVNSRLDADTGTRTAAALVTALGKTDDPSDLYVSRSLAEGLEVMSERLDASAAARAAEVLVTALDKNRVALNSAPLGRCLHAVSKRMDAPAAAGVADALLSALSKTTDANALSALASGLHAVSERLDSATATRAALVLVVVVGTHKNLGVPGVPNPRPLAVCLQGLSQRLASSKLVDLLQHPLAAGPARRVLLDALGQRNRRTFRSSWHFLDWARSNGVEFGTFESATRADS